MAKILPNQAPVATSNSSAAVYPSTISFASGRFGDTLPERYLSNGEPVSWEEAKESYRTHRLGEEASADVNGYQGGLQMRARRKNGAIHEADRMFRADFNYPAVGLVTIVGSYSPNDPDYGPIMDYEYALSEAMTQTTNTIRYRLRRYQSAEYALIKAGTETNGIPHWHLLVWADEADSSELRSDLVAIVCRAQEELPSNLREFEPDVEHVPSESVLIDQTPNSRLEEYPSDPIGKPVHPIARYVANQLPHLGNADPEENSFDGMTESEVRFGAIVDASSSRGFRSSSDVPTY